ncbi:MAG: hypothetical protein IJU64_06575 [Bacilli bacterium]|nr:hypothetical protein [Bacilli bacterium]
MKRSGNPKLKIIAATSMVIFSLAAAFSGAYAWFDSVSMVKENANSFPVSPISGDFKSLTIYPSIDTSRTEMHFDLGNPLQTLTVTNWNPITVTSNPLTPPTITMGEYDLLEPSQPLLLVFDFDKDVSPTAAEPIHIKANSSKDYYLGSVDSIEGKDDVKGKYPMSSVVACYAKSFTTPSSSLPTATYSVTIEGVTTDYDHTWTLTYEDRDADYTKTSFVYFDTESAGKVEGPHFNSSISVFKATSGTVRSIAVVLDYYANAIDYVFNNFLGLEEMHFACDWVTVV